MISPDAESYFFFIRNSKMFMKNEMDYHHQGPMMTEFLSLLVADPSTFIIIAIIIIRQMKLRI